YGTSHGAALVAVVRQTAGHQQGAQVGVTQAQGPVVERVATDSRGGVGGVIDNDFLGQDENADRVAKRFHVELAVIGPVFHEVETGQVARRVVQEHVLAAGIGRV